MQIRASSLISPWCRNQSIRLEGRVFLPNAGVGGRPSPGSETEHAPRLPLG
jgi:hypothetical protein